ncbi:MAG TPA: hypothetical protein VGR63_15175 [Casimicrobiaceae bacterium]|jgi:hypothetical protein|nr:hypothetical protein [Casimicrobiaceae bacterium]
MTEDERALLRACAEVCAVLAQEALERIAWNTADDPADAAARNLAASRTALEGPIRTIAELLGRDAARADV